MSTDLAKLIETAGDILKEVWREDLVKGLAGLIVAKTEAAEAEKSYYIAAAKAKNAGRP